MITINDEVSLVSPLIFKKGYVLGWTDDAVSLYNQFLGLGVLTQTGGNLPGTIPGPPSVDPTQFVGSPFLGRIPYSMGAMIPDTVSGMFGDFGYSDVLVPDPPFVDAHQITQLSWDFLSSRDVSHSASPISILTGGGFSGSFSLPFGITTVAVQNIDATDTNAAPFTIVVNESGDRDYLNPSSIGYGNMSGMGLVGSVFFNGLSGHYFKRVKIINFYALYKLP